MINSNIILLMRWDMSPYIKEDNVAISISIVQINPIKTLWELNITSFPPHGRIHHEAHSFTKSFAVIKVVITINIQKIGTIGQDSWYSDLKIQDKSMSLPWNRKTKCATYRWNHIFCLDKLATESTFRFLETLKPTQTGVNSITYQI